MIEQGFCSECGRSCATPASKAAVSCENCYGGEFRDE